MLLHVHAMFLVQAVSRGAYLSFTGVQVHAWLRAVEATTSTSLPHRLRA